jgi:phosphopantetheine--protein transferase-like protein
MIGVGIDAVDIERFRSVLARTPTFATRVFTPAELEYAGRAIDPAPRLAVRFAAKEAVMKALGVGLGAFALRDVEVLRDGRSGPPTLTLSGGAAALSSERGVSAWHLSLSHTDVTAVAVAVAS